MRQRQAQQGFTLIEVMVSLTVFMVAVTGLVAMQKASFGGAQKGRQSTAAVSVARFVITALQNEVMAWPMGYAPTAFSATSFPLMSAAVATPNVWMPLDANNVRVDEFLGVTSDTTQPEYHLCVTYMVEPLGADVVATPANAMAWRLRVRASWTRRGELNRVNDWTSCTVANVNARLAAGGSDEAVELVTIATRGFAR